MLESIMFSMSANKKNTIVERHRDMCMPCMIGQSKTLEIRDPGSVKIKLDDRLAKGG